MLAVLAFVAAGSMYPGPDMRDVALHEPSNGEVASTVAIDAPAYTRTVTASSYTLTGTFTGSVPTWSAAPSGSSGACVNGGSGVFSCVVTVTPDAVGEGVEVITVANVASDTETLGFYVTGAHSVFLSQNVDGSYNDTLADLDAVATWTNLGSSGLNVTSGVGSAQPTFRTSIVGGQPIVRCDGGDGAGAALPSSNWDWLVDGTDKTMETVFQKPTLSNGSTWNVASSSLGSAQVQSYEFAIGAQHRVLFKNAAGTVVSATSPAASIAAGKFYLSSTVLDDDAGAGVDLTINVSGAAAATGTSAGAYGTVATAPINLCSRGNGSEFFTGDLFRVLIYQSALDATQRGINKAVDEWALGASLPVTP